MWSSAVIKIVKMKYNQIKSWLVSTSFIIYMYIDILSNLYITFTIFYYNTISLKCTFFPVLVKGLYQTESYSLHVLQLIRISESKLYAAHAQQRTTFVNCFSSSMIMRFPKINSTVCAIFIYLFINLFIYALVSVFQLLTEL